MGYLVYCPTCGGKMSNNASRCPHCGESYFFKQKKIQVTCTACGGSGKCTVHSCLGVRYSNGKITYPRDFLKTGEYWDQSYRGGEGDWVPQGDWEDKRLCDDAKKAVAQGRYRIDYHTFTRDEIRLANVDLNAFLKYNERSETCDDCKGTGTRYILDDAMVDTRERVDDDPDDLDVLLDKYIDKYIENLPVPEDDDSDVQTAVVVKRYY